MEQRAKRHWRLFQACASILAAFITAPVDAKPITEDDWIDVGRGSNGNLWSLQWLSVINFQDNQKSYAYPPTNAWIRIMPKKGAYNKVYWSIGCSDRSYFTLSRVTFSRSGEQLSRWDNPRSVAPRALSIWSYAAPGTIESKIIDAFCTTEATHPGSGTI